MAYSVGRRWKESRGNEGRSAGVPNQFPHAEASPFLLVSPINGGRVYILWPQRRRMDKDMVNDWRRRMGGMGGKRGGCDADRIRVD